MSQFEQTKVVKPKICQLQKNVGIGKFSLVDMRISLKSGHKQVEHVQASFFDRDTHKHEEKVLKILFGITRFEN